MFIFETHPPLQWIVEVRTPAPRHGSKRARARSAPLSAVDALLVRRRRRVFLDVSPHASDSRKIIERASRDRTLHEKRSCGVPETSARREAAT
jgi:hypothetical protein